MTPDQETIRHARHALEALGVSVADLQATEPTHQVPTVAEYLPHVQRAAGPGANRTYGTYWNQMAHRWKDRRLDEILVTDVEALMREAAAKAVPRRNGRGGRHAGEHLIAAARAFFTRAIADGHLPAGTSPAHQVAKPSRLPSPRRALTPHELAAINEVARTTGNDTALDALLLRLHTETACRRGGALALRLRDLDPQYGQILLREKGETTRWQPVSLKLANHLLDHANARGAAEPDCQLLRYRTGRPLTSRRYDQLWHRLGEHLPWVAAQNISTHWLRHTTLTWVERNFGYGIARAYAGHTENKSAPTTTYIKANLPAVAAALAALTGQPHPLAATLEELGFRV
jgi:integrase